MKKILFCIGLLFISTNVFALDYALFDKTTCPTQNCSSGTFMGDDGKCYDCEEDNETAINCIGVDIAKKSCPKRFIKNCYGDLCFLKCPKGYTCTSHINGDNITMCYCKEVESSYWKECSCPECPMY